MSNPGQFKPGQVPNPGGRSREQRSAARQQASLIQKLTGNGKLTAEFALALLIAGGEPDSDDAEDAEVMGKLAGRTLKRYGIDPKAVTLWDKKWAAQYLDDRGLGKPVVDIDITSDGQAVGSVSLIPINLGDLTDAQLAEVKRRVREALPPGDGDEAGR